MVSLYEGGQEAIVVGGEQAHTEVEEAPEGVDLVVHVDDQPLSHRSAEEH